ncbi:MAG: MCE family protein [Alphaproteobacteria bacterium]|nr:MCE family protein [Alphaproteobacteria bacterium]
MRESVFETLVGLVVLVVAGIFLWFTLVRGGDASALGSDTVELGARFSSAASIDRGTDVRMAGVKIGTVRDVALDRERSEAKVTFAVRSDILPLGDGTTARVQSDGLLGGSYINIEEAEGFDQIVACAEGEALFGETGCGEILYSQGTVDLMTLFASFASGNGGEPEE